MLCVSLMRTAALYAKLAKKKRTGVQLARMRRVRALSLALRMRSERKNEGKENRPLKSAGNVPVSMQKTKTKGTYPAEPGTKGAAERLKVIRAQSAQSANQKSRRKSPNG